MVQTPDHSKRSGHARIAPFSRPAYAGSALRDAQTRVLGHHPRPFAGPPARTAVNDQGDSSATLMLVVADAPELTAIDVVEDHIETSPAWAPAAESVLDLSSEAIPAMDAPDEILSVEQPPIIAELSDAERVARRFEALASHVRSGEIGVVGVDRDAPDAVFVATFLASVLRTHP